ncbi:hypothetical protein C7453_1052 [Gluconacetobacter liquefaciens]|uniref:Short subunit dehydrogenase n=1 Tax=Gluconacetobacter liquefaciens TaxID=89584 RepID=A0A370G1H2_GLULI|nr:hypothetical protein C7453_1052 [Gluconacetobacter liquefaciens]
MHLVFQEFSRVTAEAGHQCLAGGPRLNSIFENDMQKLPNKTCVVTGSARGVGRAIAARFHGEGAVVIVTDVDDAAIMRLLRQEWATSDGPAE